ncbi:MAG: GNAT family N-acetyltransferase [Sphingobacteriaceae bacterium]
MIDFDKDYILENDKVILRPLIASDYDLLLGISTNEPDTWRFNALGASGSENLKRYIDTALNNRKAKIDYPFMVIDKAENKAIGSTRFYAINPANKTLEIGYTWYEKRYQRTYVNRNCKYLLLKFAFEQLNMERVGFRANSLNRRSIAAMKKIGCVEEGVLRNFSTDAAGNRIDAIVLSIIKSEWFETGRKNLKNKIEQGGLHQHD